MRIDTADRDQVEAYRLVDPRLKFNTVPQVLIVKQGHPYKAESASSGRFELDTILHHMQRLIEPTVPLANEDAIHEFFNARL
jgi:hypothetical protein